MDPGVPVCIPEVFHAERGARVSGQGSRLGSGSTSPGVLRQNSESKDSTCKLSLPRRWEGMKVQVEV